MTESPKGAPNNSTPTNGAAALLKFEDAVNRVLSMVRAATYGLRVGSKRLGDLTLAGGTLTSAARKNSAEEMRKLVNSFQHSDEQITEVASLAIGAHFTEFLRELYAMESAPTLPDTVIGIEELAGVPGSLAKVPEIFAIFLVLATSGLRGGILDERSLEALGRRDLEIIYTTGKMKLYRAGDRVALTDKQLEQMGEAVLEAARKLKTIRR